MHEWTGVLSECNGERTQGSTYPRSPELYNTTTPAPAGPTGPLRCVVHLSPSSVQCRHIPQTSINQSNVHKSVKFSQMSINQ